jgi:hypothetical protein
VCLLRSTDWVFKNNSVILVFRVAIHNVSSGKVEGFSIHFINQERSGSKITENSVLKPSRRHICAYYNVSTMFQR